MSQHLVKSRCSLYSGQLQRSKPQMFLSSLTDTDASTTEPVPSYIATESDKSPKTGPTFPYSLS